MTSPFIKAALPDSLHNGITMSKLHSTAIAATISLAFSVGATTKSMPKDDYQVSKNRIVDEYKSATASERA